MLRIGKMFAERCQQCAGEEVIIRLNANVDKEQAKRLKHVRGDEGPSFSEWIRRQIDGYITETGKKKKPGKGKEERRTGSNSSASPIEG